ncbi:hypothetical protein F5X68DRAFT_81190 [Plectosphaerella plurivora]|uniref:Uncharacterized protein n=1 Tax=Plectosphaerella plurivora TaxID=936078 RepID=A0A9P8VCQ7_9PEZI|nr:hypothetical protein F5X68DRAFT_81190 [Plectosphaerella plurivora]
MWYTALASALLGVGVGLVTSEPNLRRQIRPTTFKQISPHAITCQVRPEAQFIAPEPLQFSAASRGGDVEYRSFLSLSEDSASCSVVSFDLLDPSLRITPFCNETQMTACAEAVGTQWNQRADTGAAHDMPIVHILVASKDVRSVDVNLDAARPDRIAAVAAAAAPQARCTDFDSAAHDRTDDASTASPREQSQTVSSTWSAENAAALYADTLRQVKLAMYSSAKAAMAVAVEVGSASDATPAKSAVPSTRQPLASKFIGTANKQLVGMATGLAVVLFIFVVWL